MKVKVWCNLDKSLYYIGEEYPVYTEDRLIYTTIDKDDVNQFSNKLNKLNFKSYDSINFNSND
jgi:hypothetical protein